MLLDSSLTNILLVSCLRSLLPDFITSDRSQKQETRMCYGMFDADPTTNVLINAFWDLLDLTIPVAWCLSQSQPSDKTLVNLDLWVFWFDDSHTGLIDGHQGLRALDELRLGSFTWEAIFSKSQSPTASPIARSNPNTLVVVAEEYRLFIKAIRNLIQPAMIARGAIPIGDFLVYPSTCYVLDVMSSPSLKSHLDPDTATLLCVSYNCYFNGTHLVFQPISARMRVRPILLKDTRTRGRKVLLSPFGDKAHISSTGTYLTPHHLQDTILRQWSLLLHIPVQHLISPAPLPALIPVRLENGDLILYPSRLVYVPTSNRQSPSSIAGMNSLMGLNHGVTRDIGRIWEEWTHKDKIVNDQKVDYWSQNAAMSNVPAVLDLMSIDIHAQQPSLTTVLNEPVVLSTFMASKAGLSLNATSTTQPNKESPHALPHHDTKLSLSEYAKMYFTNPKKEPTPTTNDNMMVDTESNNISEATPRSLSNIHTTSHNNAINNTINNTSNPPHGTSVISNYTPDLLFTGSMDSSTITKNDMSSPNDNNLSLDDIDQMYDIPTGQSWGLDDTLDLDSFNMDVTEADFDFFESSPAPKPPVQNSLPNKIEETSDLMNIDIPDLHETPMSIKQDAPASVDTVTNTPCSTEFTAKSEQKPSINTPSSLTSTTTTAAATTANTVTATPTPTSTPTTLQIPILQQTTDLQEINKKSISSSCPLQSTIPPDFAPVFFREAVNDAKYYEGGKFTYSSPHLRITKRALYSPDYIPRPKKQAVIPNTTLSPQENASPRQNVAITAAKFNNMRIDSESEDDVGLRRPSASAASSARSEHGDIDMKMRNSGNGSNSSSSGSSSGSDYDESDGHNSDSDSDTDSDRGSDRNDQNGTDPDWIEWIQKAQQSMVYRMVNQENYKKIRKEGQQLDYDTPFSSVVGRWKCTTDDAQDISERDYRALDYLCQQAVIGGYPFSGGASDTCASGGEKIEGETISVIITRHRNIMQTIQGDVTHTPCVPRDSISVFQEFKSMLSGLFETKVESTPRIDEDHGLSSLAHHSSISIKGPLSLQNYFELSETNQAHSKYGKYQIKKRRPAEPNLAPLRPPMILVGRDDNCIEGSSDLITFWEKMRLEPYVCRKNVQYVVLCPKGERLESQADEFFRKGLSVIYETCLLGNHRPYNLANGRNGVVPVELLAHSSGNSWKTRQYKSYMNACLTLGSALGNKSVDNDQHVVIYLVNPVENLSFSLDLSRCFNALKMAFGMGLSKGKAQLVMQIVPVQHILLSSSFGGYTKFGLKEIAFSVYTRCDTVVSRSTRGTLCDVPPKTAIYTPIFVLTKPIPETIRFSLKKPLSATPILLDRGAMLHLAYTFSVDKQWLIIVWSDHRGELLEYSVLKTTNQSVRLSLEAMLTEIWTRTKEIAQRTGFVWTFTIAKLGLMFEDELKVWSTIVPQDERMVMVCVDLHTSLQISPSGPPTPVEYENLSFQPLTIPTITPETQSDTKNEQATTTEDLGNNGIGNGGVRSIMLNHRVAYSYLKEKTSYGQVVADLKLDDCWMLPLSTGYMIYDPPNEPTPCMEQYSNSPLAVEMHLICNQTARSAYTTLRKVIHQFYALSYINMMPSSSNFLPCHIVLVERLSRLLLTVLSDNVH
ncbi:mediator complex subunit 13 C-terminal-domain-containing protein [Phycomyces blakesleeanus]|uniref:Mediator of RNA polymerase II transcription subunit 13 n=1 Tax=Phycomyces blakesleeanus TaxID=4837 RepID=A0ABR3AI88_PHYBL